MKDKESAFFAHFGDPNVKISSGDVPALAYPPVPINSQTQIRVVEVLAGAFRDPIRCRLHVRDLGPDTTANHETVHLRKRYTALSYSWGGFYNHASIHLLPAATEQTSAERQDTSSSDDRDSAEFPVSRNLWCCLLRIRREDRSQVYWIDQLCINQHDLVEKSSQVPLMSEIYAQSQGVLIWLGDAFPGEELSEKIMSKRSQLARVVTNMTFLRQNWSLCWWKRLWVLQEFCLAPQEPTIQFGSCTMKWSELYTFAYEQSERLGSSTSSTSITLGVLHIDLGRFHETRNASGQPQTLLSFWWAFPQLLCFNPRDKIIGLYGMLSAEQKELINIDYQLPVEDVFAQATYAEIAHTGSLSIISLARRHASQANLPSWSADFMFSDAFELNTMIIPAQTAFWHEKFISPPRPWTKTNTDNEQIAKAKYNAAQSSLTISGFRFDRILLTLPILDAGTEALVKKTSFGKSLLASTSLTRRMIFTKQERAFREEVLSPLYHASSPYARLEACVCKPPAAAQAAFSTTPTLRHSQHKGIRLLLAETLIIDWLSHEAFEDHDCVSEEVESVQEMIWSLTHYLSHVGSCVTEVNQASSFFVTENGFLGVGPRTEMDKGDTVILPFGGRFPMVLKDRGAQSWSFGGFVYVAGLENRELEEVLPELESLEEKFVLV